MKPAIIEGRYLADVLDQPRALEATERAFEVSPELERLAARLAEGELERVVLTGMGSSLHALHPLHFALVARGFATFMVETSELLFHLEGLLKPRTLLVVVSQSGASVEIVRLLAKIPDDMPVIAVTNTAEAPLARRANACLYTHAGSEATVSCKTYLTALLALAWLGAILSDGDRRAVRQELAVAAEAVAGYLRDWRRHVEGLAGELAGARSLFLVGRGASLATVGVGGLIIKESAHFHAEGMSSSAFRHGPFEMLSAGVYVAVFRGSGAASELNDRLCADVNRTGAHARLIDHQQGYAPFCLPAAPELLRPILEMLPVEMISFALAALAGREAGRFELGSKVTTVE